MCSGLKTYVLYLKTEYYWLGIYWLGTPNLKGIIDVNWLVQWTTRCSDLEVLVRGMYTRNIRLIKQKEVTFQPTPGRLFILYFYSYEVKQIFEVSEKLHYWPKHCIFFVMFAVVFNLVPSMVFITWAQLLRLKVYKLFWQIWLYYWTYIAHLGRNTLHHQRCLIPSFLALGMVDKATHTCKQEISLSILGCQLQDILDHQLWLFIEFSPSSAMIT